MPKVRPMAPECVTYIEAIKQAEPAVKKSPFEKVAKLFNGIGKTVLLTAKNAFDTGKIAQRFEEAILDVQSDPEELAFELSFLNEAQISELKLPFSERNIDIVNKAIFQTSLIKKKELLARVGIDLERKRPLPPPPPFTPPAKLEKVKLPRLPGAIMDLIRDPESVYPEPAFRHAHLSEDGCDLKDADCTPNKINSHLKEHLPYQDDVEFFAARIEKLSDQEAASIFIHLHLWPLLYLYEVVPSRHHKKLEECIVLAYRLSTEFGRHEFKAYLTVYFRKGDTTINGRYGHLLNVIEEAEIEQIRKARVSRRKSV